MPADSTVRPSVCDTDPAEPGDVRLAVLAHVPVDVPVAPAVDVPVDVPVAAAVDVSVDEPVDVPVDEPVAAAVDVPNVPASGAGACAVTAVRSPGGAESRVSAWAGAASGATTAPDTTSTADACAAGPALRTTAADRFAAG